MNKLKIISLLFSAGVMLAACGSSKSVAELPYNKKKKFEHYYFEAAKQKVLNNTERATELFLEAYKVYPKSHATMHQLSTLYFGKGEFYEALDWAERSVSKSTQYNHYYYGQLAQCYFKLGEFVKSAKTFERMISFEPKNEELYLDACNQYLNDKDPAHAINILNKLELNIGITEVSATRKEFIYLQLGRTKDAINALRKLVETYPNQAVFRGYLGETLMNNGFSDEAIIELKEMEKLDPSFGRTQMLLYQLYLKKGDDLIAFSHLKKAFRLTDVDITEKLNAFTPYYMGFSLSPYLKFQTIELSDILLEVYPEKDIPYIVKGDVYNKMDSLEKSREYFLIATEKEGTDYRTWDKLISVDAKLGKPELQLEDSKLAIERYPNIPGFYLAKAFAYYELEDFENAIESAHEGLEISIVNADKVEFYSCIASSSDELKNFVDADNYFNKALALDPNNVLLMNNYAYSLAKRASHLEKADSLINAVLAAQPTNPFYMDTKGWIEFKRGNFENAVLWLKRSIKLDPQGTEYYEHIAEIYHAMGEMEEAQKFLEMAIERGSTIESLNQFNGQRE